MPCSGVMLLGSFVDCGAFRRFPSWGRFWATFLFLLNADSGAAFSRESSEGTGESVSKHSLLPVAPEGPGELDVIVDDVDIDMTRYSMAT